MTRRLLHIPHGTRVDLGGKRPYQAGFKLPPSNLQRFGHPI